MRLAAGGFVGAGELAAADGAAVLHGGGPVLGAEAGGGGLQALAPAVGVAALVDPLPAGVAAVFALGGDGVERLPA